MKSIFTLFLSILIVSLNAQNFDWTEQSSGTTEWLRDIQFVDNMTGWAVGDNGAIVATVDGGDTWTTQTSGTTERLRSVFFLSNTMGWIVGGNLNLTLLKTIDGGANWVPVNNDIATEAFLSGVEFADEMHGFAITAKDVYYTSNGGINWEKGSYSSSISNTNVYDLSVISDTSAFLCGRYWKNTSQMRPGVFDNIANPSGDWNNQGAGEFNTGDELRAIHFTENQKGYVGGTNGKIYTMEADGEIFPNVWYLNFDTDNGSIWSIDFADNNHGMFNSSTDKNGTTYQLIYHTSDAGETWSSTPDSIPDLLQSTLSAGDTENAWIAGSDGKIFKGTPKDITSVKDLGVAEFKVMPNPFSSSILIKSEKAYKDVQLNIFNYSGQLIESMYVGDFQYSYEMEGLEHLKGGVYFLQMTSADGLLNSTQKIVKQ